MKNKHLFFSLFLCCFLHAFYSQNHYVIFINGYRGINIDDYTTDGRIIDPKIKTSVHSDSSFKSDEWIIGYWRPRNLYFDDTILSRYKNAYPLYIDGHHPISSSVHRNKKSLVASYLKSRIFFFCRNPKGILFKKSSDDGFNVRVENGKKIGQKLKENYFIQNDTKITIVCHSMGFAVALGICEVLKQSVEFKDFIILSPEGADNARFDWTKFQHVWHYSSSWKNNHYRLVCRQDGIAPQVPIHGLKNNETEGIIGVPSRSKQVKLGFYKSHHLSYYNWFFDIKKGERGYFGDY